MHCFYIEPPVDGMAALKRDEAKHAARVLRLKPGDAVCAMDGAGGRWNAEILRVDADGVAVRLVPVKMDRCVVKLDEKDGRKRRERLGRIALEAAKQCQRARAAKISEPMTWKQALEAMRRHDLLLTPWEDARGWRMKDAYADHPEAVDIGIVIGPEGGMSEDEVRAMQDIDALTVTLGPRILRTETAAVVSAALAMQLWGDL